MNHLSRRWILCLTLAAALAPATTALASIDLEIKISGLKFMYKYDAGLGTGSLFDGLGSSAGGHGLTSEAAPLTRIDFTLIDEQGVRTSAGSITDEVYCDFLMSGIPTISSSGETVTSDDSGSRFGFDLLRSDGAPLLQLKLNSVSVNYDPGNPSVGIPRFVFASGPATELLSQNLPFPMVLDGKEPISITVSGGGTYGSVDGYLTQFKSLDGLGTGTVTGVDPPVPEPACCFAVLLAIGVIGLEIRAMKKRR